MVLVQYTFPSEVTEKTVHQLRGVKERERERGKTFVHDLKRIKDRIRKGNERFHFISGHRHAIATMNVYDCNLTVGIQRVKYIPIQ